LLAHGFSRAGRSGRVPLVTHSPIIPTMFSALPAELLAGGRR
jgi:hypothetical protein